MQCKKMGVAFIDELPSADVINNTFDVVVDALFGFSFKGAPRPPFDTVLATLSHLTKPLVSVDIPSGEYVLCIITLPFILPVMHTITCITGCPYLVWVCFTGLGMKYVRLQSNLAIIPYLPQFYYGPP